LKTRAEDPECIRIHEESEVPQVSKTPTLKENGLKMNKISKLFLQGEYQKCLGLLFLVMLYEKSRMMPNSYSHCALTAVFTATLSNCICFKILISSSLAQDPKKITP
jgi:hypothetical protein